MKQGNHAELVMNKVLRAGQELNESKYFCKVLRYDVKQECIYLVLEEDSLEKISLDIIYECTVYTAEHKIVSTGRIKERYNDENGHVLKFEIENGFYKINVKSVDK